MEKTLFNKSGRISLNNGPILKIQNLAYSREQGQSGQNNGTVARAAAHEMRHMRVTSLGYSLGQLIDDVLLCDIIIVTVTSVMPSSVNINFTRQNFHSFHMAKGPKYG